MSLVKSPGISIRRDAAWVQFGAGVSEDEFTYLYGLIRSVLASSALREREDSFKSRG
jgi:hypothetical protein